MTKPKIAVIQFPGSNTERETLMALERVGMLGEAFYWNQDHQMLANFDGYIIVGGFSYEDRSRAGIIAALDPIMQALRQESEKGKPLLGICNGAQILVESGMVPGMPDNTPVLSLSNNRRVQNGQVLGTGYYNVWTNIKVGEHAKANAFNHQIDLPMTVPIAHAEGRFVIAEALLAMLNDNGQIAFQYCDENAVVKQDFPHNPNGSVAAIAGLCNTNGNVLALMPHPERTDAGDGIFAAMRQYIATGNYSPISYLDWSQQSYHMKPYQADQHAQHFPISLIITDNHAASVQTALQAGDIDVTVKRQIYWEVSAEAGADANGIEESIINSGELWNSNKEVVAPAVSATRSILVLPHDDMLGQQKQQLLAHHFSIAGIQAIKHGILWHLDGTDEAITAAINSHILFNPESHDAYDY